MGGFQDGASPLIEEFLYFHDFLVLIQIGVPSLTLLYMLDETSINSQISLKAIGQQWYWRYEFRDRWVSSPEVSYDSYIVPRADQESLTARLLEVDNRVSLP